MRTWTAWIFAGFTVMMLSSVSQAENASSASVEASQVVTLTRDPFWPVGWEPPQMGPVTGDMPTKSLLTNWDEARALLQVTGLSKTRDGKYLAILKRIGVVEQGDTVSVNFRGLNYKWKIASVTSKGIVPERIGVYPVK